MGKQPNTNAENQPILVPTATGFAVGCLFSLALGLLSLWLGFCILLPDDALSGAFFTALIILTLTLWLRLRKKMLSWRFFGVVVFTVVVGHILFCAWSAPISYFQGWFAHNGIPSGLKICQVRAYRLGPDGACCAHIKGPATAIMGLLQENNATPVTNSFEIICPHVVLPQWWTPEKMERANAYQCLQYQRVRLIWVNSQTNEAYLLGQ